MSRINAAWGSMAAGTRVLAIGGLVLPVVLVTVLAVSVMGAAPAPAPEPSPSPMLGGELPTDAPTPNATASASTPGSAAPSASPSAPGPDPLLGTDGRLTVLLLGSDHRAAHPGHRTDTIMVVSIDPTTGKSAAFSVPRDIVDFPLPGGKTFRNKVNGLFMHLQATTKRGAASMKAAMADAFDVEIDNYVLIGFTGVRALVKAVGGVDVTLEKAYYDPYYWVNNRTRGWGLPKGKSHLNAEDALIFARSRKGDSDFGRARRQQLLVMAAVAKVRKRGIDDLPKLLRIAEDTVRTDLPLERAPELFDLFSSADLGEAKQAIFGPSKYAERAGGYDYRLKLDACRAWIKKAFPKVRPNGTWPVAAASAAPSGAGASAGAAPAPSASPSGG